MASSYAFSTINKLLEIEGTRDRKRRRKGAKGQKLATRKANP